MPVKKKSLFLGITLLATVTFWAFYIHIPILTEGYINAGDDHIHVVFANELARIMQEEGRVFGWSQLFGAGAPLFLLRPPGLYIAVAATHFLASITVEEAEKVVVVLGFCLYPLSVFLGGRLLGLGFWPAVLAGCLAPLGISVWGHTLDAYQYLGIHKQLLAILLFPIASGALWRLLTENRCGLIFALVFPFVFITHPYIAYCMALLVPAMLLATADEGMAFLRRLPLAFAWAMSALLIVCIWLIPFLSSHEIQAIDPFLGRRNYFDVTGCTTAETLRQFFLGGLLDTTSLSGPFGGVDWTPGNEWGWLDNSANFRLPAVTLAAVLGFMFAAFRSRSGGERFLLISLPASLIIFIGPDDFPFLDHIPFANDFQNIHAIFLVEWVAFLLGGLGLARSFAFLADCIHREPAASPRGWGRCFFTGCLALFLLTACGTAFYERTQTARSMVDVRPVNTVNGRLRSTDGQHLAWQFFLPVVQKLIQDKTPGEVALYPQEHEDSVLSNLLPRMVDRSLYITGFENIGGVYDILDGGLRGALRDNYNIQQLFNIRFVVNSPFYRKEPMTWHAATTELVRNKYWELRRVEGNFGEIDGISGALLAFSGSEAEWMALMEKWLERWRDGLPVPWLVNVTQTDLDAGALDALRPHLSGIILGKEARPPASLSGLQESAVADFTFSGMGKEAARLQPLKVTRQQAAAGQKHFRVDTVMTAPILMKQAFYRGWRVTVNGQGTPLYRVAPGLQLVLLPAGEHDLAWTYTGPNRWRLARFAAVAGLVLAAGLFLFQRQRGLQNYKDYLDKKSLPGLVRLPTLLAMICLTVFAWKSFTEVALHEPVLISPRHKERFAAGQVNFFWNHITGLAKSAQEFRVEVARDKACTDKILFQELHAGDVSAGQLKPSETPYWFRISMKRDGGALRWSTPVPFYVDE